MTGQQTVKDVRSEARLAPRPAGGYDVTLDGRHLGHVEKLARIGAWAWYMPGEPCQDHVPTRLQAVQRLINCHAVRDMVANEEARATARAAAQDSAAQAAGYKSVHAADLEPGQITMIWDQRNGMWRPPVLVVDVKVNTNRTSLVAYLPAGQRTLPPEVLLSSPGADRMMTRLRTADWEPLWDWWLAATDDSPDACAARAVPPGWAPCGWQHVTSGNTVRLPLRIRSDRVYEWSCPRVIDTITVHDDGRAWVTYSWTDFDGYPRRGHDLLPALLAAHGVLRPTGTPHS